MACASPVSPVSAWRSGRMMSSSTKWRSSRRSRGSSPARRNDDFPDPDGPSTTNRLSTPVVRIARSMSSARTIWASRPKNTPGVEFFERFPPAIRRPVGLTGWGPDKVLRRDPGAADRLAQLMQTGLGEHHRRPAAHRNGFDILVGQPVGEQVGVLPLAGVSAGAVLQAGAQNLLAQVFCGPVLGQALGRGFPVVRQQTDDRFAPRIGANELVFPLPARFETGVGDRCPRKISLASGGSWATSHARNASAWRLSLLE